MPRIRRRTLKRQPDWAELDQDLVRHLVHGNFFFDGFPTAEALASAWKVHRKIILPPFLKVFPGYRPFAEWLAVLVPKYGERRVLPEATADEQAYRECERRCHFGILHVHVWPALQEPEEEYLRRNDVLTAAEARAIEAGQRRHPFDLGPSLWESHLRAIYEKSA
jgi:hypothetical protein